MPSNIPSTNFYLSIFSKPLPKARRTLRNNDFMPKTPDLSLKIIAQGVNVVLNRATLTKQLKRAYQCYATFFQKFDKTFEEINIMIMNNTHWWIIIFA